VIFLHPRVYYIAVLHAVMLNSSIVVVRILILQPPVGDVPASIRASVTCWKCNQQRHRCSCFGDKQESAANVRADTAADPASSCQSSG
jgi:hypothetical protein